MSDTDTALDELIDKVSLNSARGYTKVGLKAALEAWKAKEVVKATKGNLIVDDLLIARLKGRVEAYENVNKNYRSTSDFDALRWLGARLRETKFELKSIGGDDVR